MNDVKWEDVWWSNADSDQDYRDQVAKKLTEIRQQYLIVGVTEARGNTVGTLRTIIYYCEYPNA